MNLSSNYSAAADDANSAQSPSLGLTSLVAIVIANMIGVGLFTASGYSLAVLGNPGRVMFAWSLCGVWAICGAISYGGLVSRLPLSGGEYLYLSRFVHPSIGFLAGWISLVAGFTAPIALAAKAAAAHMATGSPDWTVNIIAAGLVILATLFHLAGVRIGTSAQNGIVLAKLVLMLWVIIFAFFLTASSSWQGAALPDRDTGWLPESGEAWWILAGSMSWIALSYTGFNAGIYVAGESKRSRRWVPLSMILGTLVVTVIYLVLNYIFVFYPQPQLIAGEDKVAAIAAQSLGGERLSLFVRIIIILSTCSSVFAMLMLGPRVYRQMSLDRVFPSLFSDGSYRPGIVLQCVLSAAVCFAGSILDLMTYLGLTLSACGALAVSSLLWVRRSIPDARPLSIVELVATITYLSMTVLLIVAHAPQRPAHFWSMVATFGVGMLVFFAWRLSGYRSSDSTTSG
jgi:amino acid transporter